MPGLTEDKIPELLEIFERRGTAFGADKAHFTSAMRAFTKDVSDPAEIARTRSLLNQAYDVSRLARGYNELRLREWTNAGAAHEHKDVPASRLLRRMLESRSYPAEQGVIGGPSGWSWDDEIRLVEDGANIRIRDLSLSQQLALWSGFARALPARVHLGKGSAVALGVMKGLAESVAAVTPDTDIYDEEVGTEVSPIRVLLDIAHRVAKPMPTFEEASQEALGPRGSAIVRGVGHAIPVVAVAGPVGGMLRPLGPVIESLGTGATVGAMFTEEDRALGAATGALSFGLARGFARGLEPVFGGSTRLGGMQKVLLGSGLDPGLVRQGTARLLPHLSRVAIADAPAFTAIGALDPSFRESDMDLLDLYLINLGVVGSLSVGGAGINRFNQRLVPRVELVERQSAQEAARVSAQRLIGAEGGPLTMEARKGLALPFLQDPVAVEVAYRQALKGTKLPEMGPRAVEAFLRDPDSVRDVLSPEQVKDLFARDVEVAKREMPPPRPVPRVDKAGTLARVDMILSRHLHRIELKRLAAQEEASRLESAAGQVQRETDAQVSDLMGKVRQRREVLQAQKEHMAPKPTEPSAEHYREADDLIKAHGPWKRPKDAKEFMLDERSHGDEYAAEAARLVWNEMFGAGAAGPRASLRDYIAKTVQRAEAMRAADEGIHPAGKRTRGDPLTAPIQPIAEMQDVFRMAAGEGGYVRDIPETVKAMRRVNQQQLAEAHRIRSEGNKKAAALRKEANAVVQGERKARLERFKRINKLQQRHMDLLDEQADAAAKVLPADSVGARILEEGGIRDAALVMERLRAAKAAVQPDHPMDSLDVTTPQGAATLRSILAGTSRTSPAYNSSAAMVDSGVWEVRQPTPIKDWLRGAVYTMPKIFGKTLGEQTWWRLASAQAKSSQVQDLVRGRLANAVNVYNKWLKTLTEPEYQAAIERMFTLKEGGNTVGTHPAETEMLTTLRQTLGRMKRMLEARQKRSEIQEAAQSLDEAQFAGDAGEIARAFKRLYDAMTRPVNRFAPGDEYMPHIFETLEITPGNEAKVARSVIAKWRNELRGGSKYLRQRKTTRTDYSRDLFQVLDAYFNSTLRYLHGQPVTHWVQKVLPQRIAEMNLRAGSVDDIRVQQRRAMETRRALDFAEKHAKALLGAHESATADWMDAKVQRVARHLGWDRIESMPSPTRSLLRGLIYARYVGTMGLPNIGTPLRNLTQIISAQTEIGPSWVGKGFRDFIVREPVYYRDKAGARQVKWRWRLNPILRDSGVLSGRFQKDIEAQITRGLARGIKSYAQDAGDLLLSFFGATEIVNRGVTYIAAFHKAKAAGYGDAKAKMFARQKVAMVQFDYTAGLGGLAYTGPFAHLAFQFVRFGTYQADWLYSVFRRSMGGEAPGMLPNETKVAPIIRMGAAALIGSGLVYLLHEELGAAPDTPEINPIASMPEPVQLVGLRVAEWVGERLDKRTPLLGRQKGRKVSRALGFSPYQEEPVRAIMQMFSPTIQELPSWGDLFMGSDRSKRMAEERLWQAYRRAFPGTAPWAKGDRLMQEVQEGKVRSRYGAGEPQFELTTGESVLRALSINTTRVAEQYDALRDDKRLREAMMDMVSAANADARDTVRAAIRAGDYEAAHKAFGAWVRAHEDIYYAVGRLPWGDVLMRDEEPFDHVVQMWQRQVIEPVVKGEGTTEAERLMTGRLKSPMIDRSRIVERQREREDAPR